MARRNRNPFEKALKTAERAARRLLKKGMSVDFLDRDRSRAAKAPKSTIAQNALRKVREFERAAKRAGKKAFDEGVTMSKQAFKAGKHWRPIHKKGK